MPGKTARNLPLWPLVYYRKENAGDKMKHALYPFFFNYMTVDGTSDFSFSFFVFLFRCGLREGKFSIDFLWPFLHFSYDNTKHTYFFR